MKLTSASTLALLALFAHVAAAQPPRPSEAPRSVTLSLNEYNRLLDLANRPTQPGPAAPVPALLASADLKVRVERDTVRGAISLAGEVLRAGVARVNLISGATLVDASAAGRALPLVTDGGAHAALLPGPSPFSLTLEWGAAMSFTPGRASFQLPVPPAGTARATFDVPGEQADLHLSAGLITKRSAVSGRTIVEAALTPGSLTEVWWSMRDTSPVAAAKEARTLADVMTLVTIGDSDVRMVALIDLTVVQGEPRSVEVHLPAGYEVTSITGSSLERSDPRDGSVLLTIADPAVRRHQFLIGLERAHEGGSFAFDTGFVTVAEVQRERGEIAVEGVGTLELTAAERDGIHRIDVRELNPALQTLSRQPILAAFRYQRAAAAPPSLAIDVKRFADAGVLAAVADRAVATTLVTAEGRALTELSLVVRNRAQPFLKVTLPEGASIVSVEVAGETAKPVLGADGTRVPLLRPSFRPQGPYTVSFVYVHAGTPFGRKGDMNMMLPRLDMPIGVVEWEIFVPENYSVRATGGNVLERQTYLKYAMNAELEAQDGIRRRRVLGGGAAGVGSGTGSGYAGGAVGGVAATTGDQLRIAAVPGQIVGRIVDASGAPLAGVTIDMDAAGERRSATSDVNGVYRLSNVQTGTVTLTANLLGFAPARRSIMFNQQPAEADFVLSVGGLTETVTVVAGTEAVASPPPPPPAATPAPVAPSQNVINLQRRASGVLPIRIDVPRAGTSHQFLKPLVVDVAPSVSLKYRRR